MERKRNNNKLVEKSHEGKAIILRYKQLQTDRTVHNNKPDNTIRDS